MSFFLSSETRQTGLVRERGVVLGALDGFGGFLENICLGHLVNGENFIKEILQ
jgi:hypothetical protein